MSDFVKCKCQHCDGHIAFDASNAGETVACPHCGLETIIFAPATQPTTISSQDVKKWKRYILPAAVVLVIFSAAAWASYLHPKFLIQLFLAGIAIVLFAAFVFVVWAISVHHLWMRFFSVTLFACGALSTCMGVLVWAGLLASKEGTVFQEYEGIFFSLGGLIIIALSLILTALLASKK
jgi:ribosomal protein S27E